MLTPMSQQPAALHLHLDVVGGIAGDMFCASIIDAYPHLEKTLLEKLKNILPQTAGMPTFWQDKNLSIRVMRFALHNEHVKEHAHSHTHTEETTYTYLKKQIEKSDLSECEKQNAISILTILAKAEAHMHSTTIEQVHFHELADWDSLMDIVAAAILLCALNIHSVSFSTLPLGSGRVQTQHGLLPIPAPATAEILKGFEFFDDGVQGERITPTGAAILKFLSMHYKVDSVKSFELAKSGYGGGSKTFPSVPNILRAVFFKPKEQYDKDAVYAIEFDVDDMTPEELAVSLDIIRNTLGVIDVSVVSARGKKGRNIEKISILAALNEATNVMSVCFSQTTTLGLRHSQVSRTLLKREEIKYQYDNITVNVKKSARPKGEITYKAQSDDLSLTTLKQRRRLKSDSEKN